MKFQLSGVYAAAVTPLNEDLSLDRDGLFAVLDFLALRGCHGALLLGTTGEGPSFSYAERKEIFSTAVQIREKHPDFRLLAGVGTPSVDETSQLTRLVFDLGFEGVVVLPPYYFRSASEDGLYLWYETIIRAAVPGDGAVFGYHIPGVSGVPLSFELIARLRAQFPSQFLGIKDSSGSLDHAHSLGSEFGNDLMVLNGTDRLLTKALQAGASGCITALGNLVSPELRSVYDSFLDGKTDPAAQAMLSASRDVSEKFQPAAPLIKHLLAKFHNFPEWAVKPPLQHMPEEKAARARLAWQGRGKYV